MLTCHAVLVTDVQLKENSLKSLFNNTDYDREQVLVLCMITNLVGVFSSHASIKNYIRTCLMKIQA